VLVFGDFSTELRDRYSTSEEWEELREIGFSSIFDPKPESYTRSQIYLSMLKSSYLDYFLVKGLSHTNFSIQGNLGSSDNCRLAIDITNLTPLKNKVEPDMIFFTAKETCCSDKKPHYIKMCSRSNNRDRSSVGWS
jgi:hypothetical protein